MRRLWPMLLVGMTMVAGCVGGGPGLLQPLHERFRSQAGMDQPSPRPAPEDIPLLGPTVPKTEHVPSLAGNLPGGTTSVTPTIPTTGVGSTQPTTTTTGVGPTEPTTGGTPVGPPPSTMPERTRLEVPFVAKGIIARYLNLISSKRSPAEARAEAEAMAKAKGFDLSEIEKKIQQLNPTVKNWQDFLQANPDVFLKGVDVDWSK